MNRPLSSDLRRRLSRLNHLLIPEKKAARDRVRRSWAFRLLTFGVSVLGGLSREGRVAALLTIPVGLSALDVKYGQVYLLLALGLGLLGAGLLLRPLFPLRAVSVHVAGSSRVSVGQEMCLVVSVCNHGRQELFDLRVTRPFLPWDGHWQRAAASIPRLGPSESRSLVVSAVFRARGEHHLDAFQVGRLLPGGLAVGPCVGDDGTRFVVVPQLVQVESLALSGEGPAAAPPRSGSPARARGEAELAGLRPYRPGDALRYLDVRAWARTGEPHVRQLAAPRREAALLALLTPASGLGEVGFEAMCSLTAGVGVLLSRRAGGLSRFVCDAEVIELDPAQGEAAAEDIIDKLAEPVLEVGPCEPSDALRRVAEEARRVVVVSGAVSAPLVRWVRELSERGVACRWLIVSRQADFGAPLPEATVVPVAHIAGGEALWL